MPDGIAVGELGGRPVAAVSRFIGPFQLWDLASDVLIDTPVTDAIEVGERVQGFVQVGAKPVLLTCRGHEVRVRDLESGEASLLDPDDLELVSALAVREGRIPLVAVAREDARVRVFDLRTGTAVDEQTLPYAATALAWAPSGDLIVGYRRTLLRCEIANRS
ncbi:hypothetical protein ACFQ07_02295, partial [Actinomadura adrarensis]